MGNDKMDGILMLMMDPDSSESSITLPPRLLYDHVELHLVRPCPAILHLCTYHAFTLSGSGIRAEPLRCRGYRPAEQYLVGAMRIPS
jgi:hypothetical protein